MTTLIRQQEITIDSITTAFAFNHCNKIEYLTMFANATPKSIGNIVFFLDSESEHRRRALSHALIVVDSSEDSFYDGIAGNLKRFLINRRDRCQRYWVIFVRCLQMKDLNKVSAAERQKMDATILKSIESEADSLFVVLMQMGNARHWILEVNSQNALTALKASKC